ncbi:hypothetical protein D9M71_789540 [compost metagenome]
MSVGPIGLTRGGLPRQHVDQMILFIEKQHAIQERKIRFDLEQRLHVTAGRGLIGNKPRHVRVIGQCRDLVKAIIEK